MKKVVLHFKGKGETKIPTFLGIHTEVGGVREWEMIDYTQIRESKGQSKGNFPPGKTWGWGNMLEDNSSCIEARAHTQNPRIVYSFKRKVWQRWQQGLFKIYKE